MQEELLFLTSFEANEEERALDYIRMKHFYPEEVGKYSEVVEQECDKLEYDGSAMYAPVVDRNALERIANRITDQCLSDESVFGRKNCPPEKPCRDTVYPIVLTLLCNEMYVRRCRKCRRDRMFCNN